MTTIPAPGPLRERAVAEALGLTYVTERVSIDSPRPGLYLPVETGVWDPIYPSTDPIAAFRLVLWLHEQDWHFMTESSPPSGFTVSAARTGNSWAPSGLCKDFADAVTRAVLEAVVR